MAYRASASIIAEKPGVVILIGLALFFASVSLTSACDLEQVSVAKTPSVATKSKEAVATSTPYVIREYPEKQADGSIALVAQWTDGRYTKKLVEAAPTPYTVQEYPEQQADGSIALVQKWSDGRHTKTLVQGPPPTSTPTTSIEPLSTLFRGDPPSGVMKPCFEHSIKSGEFGTTYVSLKYNPVSRGQQQAVQVTTAPPIRMVTISLNVTYPEGMPEKERQIHFQTTYSLGTAGFAWTIRGDVTPGIAIAEITIAREHCLSDLSWPESLPCTLRYTFSFSIS